MVVHWPAALGITKELVKKCRISGPTLESLNQNFHFNKFLKGYMCASTFEEF